MIPRIIYFFYLLAHHEPINAVCKSLELILLFCKMRGEKSVCDGTTNLFPRETKMTLRAKKVVCSCFLGLPGFSLMRQWDSSTMQNISGRAVCFFLRHGFLTCLGPGDFFFTGAQKSPWALWACLCKALMPFKIA